VAGKGGGSWKVAYADFVTAMMAFFLVMWIGAQDVKVRQSVANYFVDPSGVAKSPRAAGVMQSPSPGSIPHQAEVQNGRGARTPANEQKASVSTAAVLSWIRENPTRLQYWKAQAQKCRDTALAQHAANQAKSPDDVAVEQLAQMMSSELVLGIPAATPEVYKRMMIESLKEVNWAQVAGEIFAT
jgi:flagellar motor protein MotB